MKQEVMQEALKATPPVSIAIAEKAAGWTLNDTVLTATLIYVIMQAGYLVWKWLREYRRRQR